MHDVLSPGAILGYCTNVHAGTTLEQTMRNLTEYAVPVKQRVSPNAPMGIGLWLAAKAAREMIEQQRIDLFRRFLDDASLFVYTLNGFPHGDFHEPIVKHKVYKPTWAEAARFDYTADLIHILTRLLPPGAEGSISTLPIGWKSEVSGEKPLTAAAMRLRSVAQLCAQLEAQTDTCIHIDLEPEPGCYLETSNDVVRYFQDYLLPLGDEEMLLRHLRVCHDICHAAVMFEDQKEMFDRYEDAGVRIGKVQISSALRAKFDNLNDADKQKALGQLGAFHEHRYLHQTNISLDSGELIKFDDLPAAVDSPRRGRKAAGEWRVHFHMPIYLEQIGLLETTLDETEKGLALLRDRPGVRHYEVETYAWNVLPRDLRVDDLSDGIADELLFIMEQPASA